MFHLQSVFLIPSSLSVVDGYIASIVGWKAKSFVEGYGADLLHACLNRWEVTFDKNSVVRASFDIAVVDVDCSLTTVLVGCHHVVFVV